MSSLVSIRRNRYDWSDFDPVQVARERVAKNSYAGNKRSASYSGNREKSDVIGVVGEAAFAYWAGLSPASVHAHGPTMHNFSLNGFRIDVRSSDTAGYLAVPERVFQEQLGKIDLYVLAKVTGRSSHEDGELIGWMPYELVQEEGQIFGLSLENPQYKSLNVRAEQLIPMDCLADAINYEWDDD